LHQSRFYELVYPGPHLAFQCRDLASVVRRLFLYLLRLCSNFLASDARAFAFYLWQCSPSTVFHVRLVLDSPRNQIVVSPAALYRRLHRRVNAIDTRWLLTAYQQ